MWVLNMNDFTKDELEKLKDGLNYGVSNPYGFTADSIMPLYDKIKDMIDNYCEHDWDNSCCRCPIESIYCTKCDKRIKD